MVRLVLCCAGLIGLSSCLHSPERGAVRDAKDDAQPASAEALPSKEDPAGAVSPPVDQPPAPVAAPTNPTGVDISKLDKDEVMRLAQEKLTSSEYADARQLLGAFVKRWPGEDLTAEAHYGVGETYFHEEKCREALFEYGKVIQEHPRSKAAPNAYLRSSECFLTLKMRREARLALDELVKQYPRSDAARVARGKLADREKSKRSSTALTPGGKNKETP